MTHRARLISVFISGALAGFAVAGHCLAADPFGGALPVGADTLQSERGGFFVADGQEFGFGATLQTLVNGQLALTTTLVLQNDGSVTRQTVVNSALPVTVVNTPADLAAATAGTGLNLTGVQGVGGVIKSSTGGATAVLDNITPSQIQNLVVSTASGQTITQNTAVTLTLPASSASQNLASQFMLGLGAALQFAQMGVGAH